MRLLPGASELGKSRERHNDVTSRHGRGAGGGLVPAADAPGAKWACVLISSRARVRGLISCSDRCCEAVYVGIAGGWLES
jgi:hypothetical protein